MTVRFAKDLTVRAIDLHESAYQIIEYAHREADTPIRASAQYPYTGQSDDWLAARAWAVPTFPTYDQRELIHADRSIWIGEKP